MVRKEDLFGPAPKPEPEPKKDDEDLFDVHADAMAAAIAAEEAMFEAIADEQTTPEVATAPALRVVEEDEEPQRPAIYDPHREQASQLLALREYDKNGNLKSIGSATQRLAVILDAWWFPVKHNEERWLLARRDWEMPSGGILVPPDKEFIERTQARFRKIAVPREPLASEDAVRTALGAQYGRAHALPSRPGLRWARAADDGALWWDAGRKDGACVRINKRGWSIEPKPAVFFRRTGDVAELPLPEPGGSLDDLWEHARILPEDRGLATAWMVVATQPERFAAAGMLYVSSHEAAGKTYATTRIIEASGDTGNRSRLKVKGNDDRDFVVGVDNRWVTLIDNLSGISADVQDLLCVLLTGFTETSRALYTDNTALHYDLRRPMAATSINIPILRPDLISRMVPVEMQPPEHLKAEDDLETDWVDKRAKIFGAVLDLLVAVQAEPRPTLPEDAPRLAVLARTAMVIDRLMGRVETETVERLVARQDELRAASTGDDPFFIELQRRVIAPWTGTSAELLEWLDPDGSLARRHGNSWPGIKAVTSVLARQALTLQRQGWTLERHQAKGHRPAEWTIVPPGGDRRHPYGCRCSKCAKAPHPAGCQCSDCTAF